MKYPNPKMMIRIAQGDAYGMACEYIKLPRDQFVYDQALKFEQYWRHPTHHKIAPGHYTDDTQMSIAVAEVLLLKNVRPHINTGSDIVHHWFAKSFFDCFKRDQRKGYSAGFQMLLEDSKSLDELLRVLKPDSDKNGAAMRAVPIGVLDNINHVKYVANIQAKVTHNTTGGTTSAIMVALMSHYAMHVDAPLRDMPGWLIDKLPNDEDLRRKCLARWDGEPVEGPEVGLKTARAVMTLVSEGDSLLGIARCAIEWGGDVDSVLSIAWGIASARMTEDLPPFFDGGLEGGEYGHKYLEFLGKKLMEQYSS